MKEKIVKLLNWMSADLIDRDDIIKISLLGILSGENIILLGPPGTAKSRIARKLSQIIDNNSYFEYLLTKYTTPEELFGPLSILKLKNDEFIKEKILKSFKSIEKNSIEDFLYNKAIDFEKSSISATHIIFNEKGSEVLGYFTLANKSLIIKKEKFEKFSKTQQKRFSQSGRILENGSCVVNSFLIAQIGKNYALKKDEQIKGMEILNIAYDLLK